jgi:hypothetical protein
VRPNARCSPAISRARTAVTQSAPPAVQALHFLISSLAFTITALPTALSQSLFCAWQVENCAIQDATPTTMHGNPLPLPSDEVKSKWSYTSTPPICLHGMNKHNFIFFKSDRHYAFYIATAQFKPTPRLHNHISPLHVPQP